MDPTSPNELKYQLCLLQSNHYLGFTLLFLFKASKLHFTISLTQQLHSLLHLLFLHAELLLIFVQRFEVYFNFDLNVTVIVLKLYMKKG